MKQISIAILVLLWAAPSLAAPVLVRSGEHGTFTRIVVDTNPSVDWDLKQDGRVVTLDLPGNPDGFSTGDVFRRITRDRLQDISADGRTLTLDLGCDCFVAATAMAPNYIILDITPGDAPGDLSAAERVAESAAESAAEEPAASRWSASIAATESYFGLDPLSPSPVAEAPAGQAYAAGAEAALPPAPAGPMVLPLVRDRAERRPFDIASTIAGGPVSVATHKTVSPGTATTAEALGALEDRLARQIGLAATQGLLKAAPDRHKDPVRDDAAGPGGDTAEPQAEATLAALLDHGGLPGNLRISSGVEGRQQAGDTVATTIDGLTCLDSALFAVQDWGTEGEFGADIARHRNALYGEFDKLDREAQIALARAYLYFGFGAEALQIAALDIREEPLDASIMVIARLLEYGPGPKIQDFSRFAECDSDVALWAILADDGTGRHDHTNIDAALRALNKLPYHLRSIVAPELSKRLRNRGDADAAAHAMRSLSRTPHEPESTAKLEQAEVDLAGGHDAKASEGFETVLEKNSFEAPLALIRFIDLQVANGEAISKDTALLAEAYAAEYRNSDLAPEISRAHMMALAKSGQFDAAFKILETARKQKMETEVLLNGLYRTLQSDADNVTFLKRTLALTESELAKIDQHARISLAERLVSLGFADKAEYLIAQVDRRTAPREQQLLRGRIHLAMGHHRQAIAAAGTFAGPEFDALRADAHYSAGEFAQAAEIYAALGQDDRAEAAAWKAPTGSVVRADQDTSLTRATDLADRPVPAVEGGLLARADALLNDSSDLSTDIEELLANPDLNIGADG